MDTQSLRISPIVAEINNIFTSKMWPLILAIAVVITGADDSGMVCPGLEITYLPPQCINERDVCPQNSTWEPLSKVCDMCGGCTAYVREYELVLHDTDIQFVIRMEPVVIRYIQIILSSSSSSRS
ncbi:hypothetical protein Cfor_09548 [Coptotermes formosanus]|jgi:hypothetical protein|uniref:Uncharacterized protein n=1 Tax=Coptotermes formosanus TaxID=36987 RepID=A0A6L2Q3Z2_COPFO|nr:hypothetical protein Cfor_09548 [Coptotermes formosanus]